MARKNHKARAPRITLAPNTHLMYSTDELYRDPIVVRYMGEYSADTIKVWNPAGYEMWVHISTVYRPRTSKVLA